MIPSRRKSVINVHMNPRAENSAGKSSAVELERLEQETTLVLQEIDHNLSRANAIINDKMFPILKKYAAATGKVWESAGFWKSFLEEAADIEIKAQNDKLPPQPMAELEPELLHSPVTNFENGNQSGSESENDGLLLEHDPDTSTPHKAAQQPHVHPDDQRLSGRDSRQLRLSISPRKHTPVRQERRMTFLESYVDSSPPLPERPVLLSDAGRQATHSSSFIGKAVLGETSYQNDSDNENSRLGRLSPVALNEFASTPQNTKKRAADQNLDLARVPTPPILHSIQRSNKRRADDDSQATGRAHRYSDQHQDLINDINDPNSRFNVSPPNIISETHEISKAASLFSGPPRSSNTIERSVPTYEGAEGIGSPIRRNMHEFENDANVFTVGELNHSAESTEFHSVIDSQTRPSGGS